MADIGAESEWGAIDRRVLPARAILGEWIAADGWRHRRIDWPAAPGVPPRGSLLLQAGRGDFVEKYIETMDHFSRAGWAVTGFDWRGQGGSHDPARIGDACQLPDLAPLVNDLGAFAGEWRAATPGPHVAIGHSMGGHVLLRALAAKAIELDAAVLVAPMLGLNSAPVPIWLATAAARGLCLLGLADRPAWSTPTEKPVRGGRAKEGHARQTNLSTSAERYADELWWRESNPAYGLGAPSWGWLVAAQAASDRLLRDPALGAIDTPVLILAAEADRLVTIAPIRRVAARIPGAALHVFGPEAAHEILRDGDAVRIDAIGRIDRFFDDRAPAR